MTTLLNYGLPWIYRVQGDSMSPTIRTDDVLLVSRLRDRNATICRGDIVVANAPGDAGLFYLKRVVGMPQDRLELHDGLLMVNEVHVVEPYLKGLPACAAADSRSWQLDDHCYFLMGDDRVHSTDSRDYGPVARAAIIGRVSRLLWPARRWRRF